MHSTAGDRTAHRMTTFEGRIALVTGASGGIGSRIAERLAGAGATVAVHYASHAEPAHELAAALGRAAAFGADLSDAEAADRLVDEVEAAFGRVDVLVANHGMSQIARLEDVDAAAFDTMLAVNLRAPFLLARRTLPGMTERGFGRVLFMSSVAGLTGGIVGPHYAASKAGLHGLTHYLARRSAGEGVTVNALAPALIEDTRMLPGDPGALATMVPVGRLGRPEEVADLALAILRNGYMTNQVVSLDGGMHPR
jgi:3-oxoacyl-[acyl-carrier protein] reductase